MSTMSLYALRESGRALPAHTSMVAFIFAVLASILPAYAAGMNPSCIHLLSGRVVRAAEQLSS